MNGKYILSALFIFMLALQCHSQSNDSALHAAANKKFKISAYIDAYYAYYTDSAGSNEIGRASCRERV